MPGFSAQFGQFAGNEFLQGPMANVAVGYGAQMANQGKEYVEKHVSLKFFCPCSNIFYDEMWLHLIWRLDLVAEILVLSCSPLIAKWYFSRKNILIDCSCNFLLFFFSDWPLCFNVKIKVLLCCRYIICCQKTGTSHFPLHTQSMYILQPHWLNSFFV